MRWECFAIIRRCTPFDQAPPAPAPLALYLHAMAVVRSIRLVGQPSSGQPVTVNRNVPEHLLVAFYYYESSPPPVPPTCYPAGI